MEFVFDEQGTPEHEGDGRGAPRGRMPPDGGPGRRAADRPSGESRSDRYLIGLLLLAVAWFWKVRVRGPEIPTPDFFATDLYVSFVPAYTSIRRALQAGSLPFWNPYLGCGTPQLAMLQSGVLYPARLLLLFASPTTALEISTIAHVLLSAVGMFALARCLGSGPCGSLAAAIGFTWGVAFGNLGAPASIGEPGAWLPVAGLAVVRLSRRGRWRDVALLAWALAAPILAGGYQVAVYMYYGVGLLWAGLVSDPAERPRAILPPHVAKLALAGGLALAFAAPQWLPTLLWSGHTLRPTGALSVAQIDPVPVAASGLIAMMVDRGPRMEGFLLPIPLVVLAGLGILSRRRSILPLGAAGVLAVVLALGTATPAFRLYGYIPGFSMFRLPYRLLYLAVFSACLAGAAGVDFIESRARDRGRRTSLVSICVFCLGLAASWLVVRSKEPARGSPNPSSPPVAAKDLVLAATESLALALPPALAGPAALAPLLLSEIGVRRMASWMPWRGREGPMEVHRPSLVELSRVAGPWRIALAGTAIAPGWTEAEGALVPFLAPGLADPLAPRRLSTYQQLLRTGEVPSPAQTFLPMGGLDLARPPRHPRLLDMASVRYLAAPRDPLFRLAPELAALLDSWPPGEPVAGSGADPGLEVRVNRGALPRAYVVDGVRPAASEAEASRAIVAPDFDPGREVVLEGAEVSRPSSGNLVAASIETYEPERVLIRTNGSADGVLVLTDTWAPGWTATVDGREVPVRPANLLFRGVPVPAGSHVVEFAYRTPGFRTGAIAAALALPILLAAPLLLRGIRGRTDGGPGAEGLST